MSHFSPDIYAKLPNKKLALKWVGPYKITKQIGKTAYKLELLMSTRFHPVFHANVLQPYFPADDNRQPTRPPPIVIKGQLEYEVEQVISHRKQHRQEQYLLKWKDYPLHESSWEP